MSWRILNPGPEKSWRSENSRILAALEGRSNEDLADPASQFTNHLILERGEKRIVPLELVVVNHAVEPESPVGYPHYRVVPGIVPASKDPVSPALTQLEET